MGAANKVWTPAEIRESLLTDARWVRKGIIALWNCQTPLEKRVLESCDGRNRIGFNAFDAKILSRIALKFINGKKLTGQEWEIAKSRILKYDRQLAVIANGPIGV